MANRPGAEHLLRHQEVLPEVMPAGNPSACEAIAPDLNYCYTMARLQESGKGTKKDPATARATFRKMCEDPMQQILDGLRDYPVCKKSGTAAKAAKPRPKASKK